MTNTMRRLGLPVLMLLLGLAGTGRAQAQDIVYYHTDALGTPVVMTDSGGNVITGSRREFEPYGRQLSPTLVADGPGYTGHVSDAATGLDYMQQRYYDPTLGKFLSTDAISVDTVTGRNFCRYCYASNNPYKNIDPDGRWDLPAWLQRMLGNRPDEVNAGRRAVGQAAAAEVKREIAPVVSGVQQVQQTATAATQAVAENTSINWRGTASAGTGFQATKNQANGHDSVGWVPVGQGAYAGVTADVKVLSVDLSGGKSSPFLLEASADVGAVVSLGGSINIDPAGKLDVTISIGLGLGEHTSFSPKLNVELDKEPLE